MVKMRFFPDEAIWEPNSSNTRPGHGNETNNVAWVNRRDEIANQMWNNRGTSHV